jgi:hypothetical protein
MNDRLTREMATAISSPMCERAIMATVPTREAAVTTDEVTRELAMTGEEMADAMTADPRQEEMIREELARQDCYFRRGCCGD